MPDRFATLARGVSAPAVGSFAIMPSDAADLAQPVRAVTISAPGVLAWHDADGVAQITGTLPQGTYPMFCRRILATGTTATGLTGWV